MTARISTENIITALNALSDVVKADGGFKTHLSLSFDHTLQQIDRAATHIAKGGEIATVSQVILLPLEKFLQTSGREKLANALGDVLEMTRQYQAQPAYTVDQDWIAGRTPAIQPHRVL